MYRALGRFDLRVKNVKTRLIPVATGSKTQAAADRTPSLQILNAHNEHLIFCTSNLV